MPQLLSDGGASGVCQASSFWRPVAHYAKNGNREETKLYHDLSVARSKIVKEQKSTVLKGWFNDSHLPLHQNALWDGHTLLQKWCKWWKANAEAKRNQDGHHLTHNIASSSPTKAQLAHRCLVVDVEEGYNAPQNDNFWCSLSNPIRTTFSNWSKIGLFL